MRSLLIAGYMLGKLVRDSAAQSGSPEAAAIDTVLIEVQRALRLVQSSSDALNLPPERSVQLKLQTVKSVATGGTLKVIVFGSRSVRKEKTHEITMSMSLPDGAALTAQEASLSSDLADAIVSVAQGVAGARQRKPVLLLKCLSVEIGFLVERGGEGGIQIELKPVSIEMKGGEYLQSVHRIKVDYRPSNPAEMC